MTSAEIAAAKTRAEDVVNGFLHVRTQQARDVIKLAAALQLALREIQRLTDDARLDSNGGDFGNIFNALMRGKKP